MGLDVTAVSRVFRAEERPDLIRLAELGIVQIDKVALIDGIGPYDHEIEEGEYWTSPDSRGKEWRAGSYGGYNAFKGELHNLFHDSGRFGQIFRANDSSSVFGTGACQKLAADFEWGLPEAERYFHTAEDRHGDFIRIYTQLLDSFRLGADGGMVYFC